MEALKQLKTPEDVRKKLGKEKREITFAPPQA
jgi:hypothetical protein